MPYLSHNYRYQPKSKLQNILEAVYFVLISAAAILFTLMVLGWFSVSISGTVAGVDNQPELNNEIIK